MFFLLFIPLIAAAIIRRFLMLPKPKNLHHRHVVITGGSSGIGKCAAIVAAKLGAHVTIIARNKDKLVAAEDEIRDARLNGSQIIHSISADVSDLSTIRDRLLEIEAIIAPIYMLVNCAGIAICGKVEDISITDVDTMINSNYLGTLYPTQVLIPKFKERKEGIIVLTSSQVALMGMFGYSVYSSCKFALRGLAESINMELRPYNVSVTLALPPDTDTPGYEQENLKKPEETRLMSASGGLFDPEVVAKQLMSDALVGKFFSYVGFESYILTTLCVGMSPFTSLIELVVQFLFLGPLRLIGVFYLRSFSKIIDQCYSKKEKI